MKNLKTGDIITFTNNAGCKVTLYVLRTTEKSYWVTKRPQEDKKGHRESWNTLNSYAKFPDFHITKSN